MGFRREIIAYNTFWTCFFFVYKLVGYFIFITLQSASNNLIDQLVSDFLSIDHYSHICICAGNIYTTYNT